MYTNFGLAAVIVLIVVSSIAFGLASLAGSIWFATFLFGIEFGQLMGFAVWLIGFVFIVAYFGLQYLDCK